MPRTKSHRKEEAVKEKATSFHGRGSGAVAKMLPRPRTVPDLRAMEEVGRPLKLTKLLLNVTVQRSPGPVHVLIPPEASVDDVIAAALRQYVKEARRPVLPSTQASAFDLHYSQFCLESLNGEEKVMELGSRNFFLFPKKAAAGSGGAAVTDLTATCSKEADSGVEKKGVKFMGFLL